MHPERHGWKRPAGWVAIVVGVALFPFAYREHYVSRIAVPTLGDPGYMAAKDRARRGEAAVFASLGLVFAGIWWVGSARPSA